jgi:hypothetical protein
MKKNVYRNKNRRSYTKKMEIKIMPLCGNYQSEASFFLLHKNNMGVA